MPEEEQPKIELSPDDLNQFWQDRGVDPTCELCHTSQWAGQMEIDGKYPSMIAQKPLDNIRESLLLPASIAICLNCGNIRIFARYIIEAWKSAKNPDHTNG